MSHEKIWYNQTPIPSSMTSTSTTAEIIVFPPSLISVSRGLEGLPLTERRIEPS